MSLKVFWIKCGYPGFRSFNLLGLRFNFKLNFLDLLDLLEIADLGLEIYFDKPRRCRVLVVLVQLRV